MKYVCSICGYVYDDSEQEVAFTCLSDEWKCPLCGAAKSDFVPQQETPSPVSVPASAATASAPAGQDVMKDVHSEAHSDMLRLSAGQLSALCSNLARGCEKQYKFRESELFRQLADYFRSITPAVEDATAESVANRLREEIDWYPEMKSTAEAAGDRGSQRVCVWGEKVTRMLSSLVNRYLKDGETMLADTEIWLCTVCGFVYIGKQAPEICPVCKVPAWKFEKIGR